MFNLYIPKGKRYFVEVLRAEILGLILSVPSGCPINLVCVVEMDFIMWKKNSILINFRDL